MAEGEALFTEAHVLEATRLVSCLWQVCQVICLTSQLCQAIINGMCNVYQNMGFIGRDACITDKISSPSFI